MMGRVLPSMFSRLMRSWIGLFALVAVAAAPGTAHAVNVGPAGALVGPAFGPLQCPNGMFMLGVALHDNAQNAVASIRGNCLAFNASTGQFVAPPQFTAFNSTASGTLMQNGCSPDHYLGGLRIGIQGPSAVTFVEMSCVPISGSGAAVAVCLHTGKSCWTSPPAGSAGGRSFTISCPSGQAATGLIGRAENGRINALGLVCGSKPVKGAAPPATATLSVPKPTSVSAPASINQMVPGQILANCGTGEKAPPAQGDNDSPTAEGILVCLINAERTARHLSALTVDASLMAETVAEGHAAVTLKWWTGGASPHNNPQTGSTPDSRIKASGYCGSGSKVKSDGEIAYNGAGNGNYSDDNGHPTNSVCLNGCGSLTATMDWWMNISAPHRALILTPGFTHIGVVAIGDMAMPNSSSFPAKGLYIVDFGSCQ